MDVKMKKGQGVSDKSCYSVKPAVRKNQWQCRNGRSRRTLMDLYHRRVVVKSSMDNHQSDFFFLTFFNL